MPCSMSSSENTSPPTVSRVRSKKRSTSRTPCARASSAASRSTAALKTLIQNALCAGMRTRPGWNELSASRHSASRARFCEAASAAKSHAAPAASKCSALTASRASASSLSKLSASAAQRFTFHTSRTSVPAARSTLASGQNIASSRLTRSIDAVSASVSNSM